ncbi:MAG: MBL fold metallo-hydrolase [Chloroflexi bacterium]|nr:MBL fold metallo-hydrolase [Chloroflexota bacterium]MBU1749169.1 MBL fold metallo-hydrolase [Chloroflexota bacterium]MBU1877833.1 MBL fold metallo-hydrolase [Chloroflexota bacterium]
MLKATRYGDVTRFDLAHTLAGRGRYWTTAYLVDGLLIDTGCAFSAAELLSELADASLTDVPLAGIATTHTHEDHIGANGPLQRRHEGLPIWAHPLALPILADPRGCQPLHPYRRLMWGWPTPSQAQAVADGAFIETERYRFQVVYTPGHSPDHLCLYEPDQGWLFTGDLFVGGKDRALRAGYDIWQIIDSLKRVAELPATTLYPGSARVRQDPAGELAAKIVHLEGLGEKVLALDCQGRSVNHIVRELMGGPMLIELITLGHFSRRRLVLSYLGRGQ